MFDYSKSSNMADNLCGSGMKCIPWIDWVGSVGIRLGFHLPFFLENYLFLVWSSFSGIDSVILNYKVNQVACLDHVGKTLSRSGHQPIIVRFLPRTQE